MSQQPNAFALLHGNRDVVELLEDAAQQARDGKLVGVVICGITEPDGQPHCGWAWAYREDVFACWARLLSAVCSAKMELETKGL